MNSQEIFYTTELALDAEARKKLVFLYLSLTPQFNTQVQYGSIFTNTMLRKAYILCLDNERPAIADVYDMVAFIKKKYNIHNDILPGKFASFYCEMDQARDMIEAGLNAEGQLLVAYEVLSMPRYSKLYTREELDNLKNQLNRMLTGREYQYTVDFRDSDYREDVKRESFMELYDLFVASGLRQVDGEDLKYNLPLVNLLKAKMTIYNFVYNGEEIEDSPVDNEFVEKLHNYFKHCVANGYKHCTLTAVETEQYFADWFERIQGLKGMELYHGMVLYMKYMDTTSKKTFMDIHFDFYLSPLLMKMRERVEFDEFDVATIKWLWKNKFSIN